MLATKEKAKRGQLAILDNRLITIMSEFQIFAKPQQLYITSDEEIKPGDWYLKPDKTIWQRSKNSNIITIGSRKIIAATDKSLNLTFPSLEWINYFIDQYDKGNVITKVMVDYEPEPIYGNNGSCGEITYQLKLNSDNTINIESIKENWSREEVELLINKHKNDNLDLGGINRLFTVDWIEQNL